MNVSPATLSSPILDAAPKPASGDEDGFGFDDLLDIVNPLQHLPIIGTIYRAITGDEIAKPAQIAGDTLYGGLLGFVGAIGTFAFEQVAGDSIDNMLTSLFDGGAPSSDDPYRAQKAYAAAQSLIS